MDKNDFFVKTGIEGDIKRIAELLNTGVFSASVLGVFQEATFTGVMIRMHDLLQKLNQLGKRISFTDDIETSEEMKDITDLVRRLRYAVCHIESGEHLLDKEHKGKVSFCVAVGKVNAISENGKTLKSDYADDIRIFYGELGIYLRRNIIRALEDAQKAYQELYAEPTQLSPTQLH